MTTTDMIRQLCEKKILVWQNFVDVWGRLHRIKKTETQYSFSGRNDGNCKGIRS